MSVRKKNRDNDDERTPFVVPTLDARGKRIEERVRVGASIAAANLRYFVAKVVLLGDSGVGKSQFSIATQSPPNECFSCTAMLPAASVTTGVDFSVIPCQIGDDTILRLQLWDTAGQERFRSLVPAYVKNTHATIIMFDMLSRDSFDAVESEWVPVIDKERGDREISVLLVGSKADRAAERQVSQVEARCYADSKGFHYMETSALHRDTIHLAVAMLSAQLFYSMMRNNTLQPSRPTTGAASTTIRMAKDGDAGLSLDTFQRLPPKSGCAC
jgi:small GTP-binding protein